MDNKFVNNLLNLLNNYSKNGEYAVISFQDIKDNLKDKYSENKLLSALNYLIQNEYIKIRYKDELEMCYCSMPKATIFNESGSLKLNNKKQLILNLVVSGVSAFLGAFLAILIVHFFL